MGDITPDQGKAVVAEAATWAGTPYREIGASSAKGVAGDCSGSTWQIYRAAGLPYSYQPTGSFASYAATSGRFRELRSDETRQDGDILLWHGHMAIYTDFAADPEHGHTQRVNKRGKPWVQVNDMWSATHTGGPPYGPNASGFFETAPPRVFRYVQ